MINYPNLLLYPPQYDQNLNKLIFDLNVLLYRGASKADVREFSSSRDRNQFGKLIAKRLPLVIDIFDYIDGFLIGGGSAQTAISLCSVLRRFYSWTDLNGWDPDIETIEELYLDWSEHILHRHRVLRNLKASSAYGMVSGVGRIFSNILGLKIGLLHKTRFKNFKSTMAPGRFSDRSNLEQTSILGHALLDIIESLSLDAIYGILPVHIKYRNGKTTENWSKLIPLDTFRAPKDQSKSYQRAMKKRRADYENDHSIRTRYPLINMRLDAELFVFVAQTGMNLRQARELKVGNFSYQSHIDGYQVRRIYKARRKGEVEFQIYSEYRPLFEKYLKWRIIFFPDSDLLFPFISYEGARSYSNYYQIRKQCDQIGIQFIPPTALRLNRINWLMRASDDLTMVAEMSQHKTGTLIRNYFRPHHQTAVRELSKFHLLTEPAIPSPGPATCIKSIPISASDKPEMAPTPDCINASGCLFCEHHRDLDSEDHIWSLASYRHLKTLELALYRFPTVNRTMHPVALTIDAITSKLDLYRAISNHHESWVSEALAKVIEGDFHPKWNGFIQIMEARK